MKSFRQGNGFHVHGSDKENKKAEENIIAALNAPCKLDKVGGCKVANAALFYGPWALNPDSFAKAKTFHPQR